MKEIQEKVVEFVVCPVVPVREIAVFPYTVLPLYVSQGVNNGALKDYLSMGKQIIFLLQKDPETENPTTDQLYSVGVVANILQVASNKDESVKLLVEGSVRGLVVDSRLEQGVLMAKVQLMETRGQSGKRINALWAVVMELFEEYIKLNKKVPVEMVKALSVETKLSKGVDVIAAQLQSTKQLQRQKLLEENDLYKRMQILTKCLGEELELLRVEERIKDRVKHQLSKVQHEYYLNEKLKAVQHELNELSDSGNNGSDVDKLRNKISAAGMPKDVREKAKQELERLAAIPSFSPEAGVIRTYLDWLIALPWKSHKSSKKIPDLKAAEEILTKEHYGLEKINERIVEYLAVQSRARHFKGPILCLVGPPGVGKTSLGESIAKATGRTFVRLSLGGVRDEAEIRGHRRTYIGAMPGRIIQKLAKAKVKNPLFMLDELDKLVNDYHGDPAAALLEVLDPEQNHAFDDHYLEVSYDLSEVMFIATANSLDIPSALLDRLEVIRVAGYTEEEKIQIAKKYLLPKQLGEHGLREQEISFADEIFLEIIQNYTREAGVRQLNRELAKICRKVLKRIVNKELTTAVVTKDNLIEFLGIPRYDHERIKEHAVVGEVNGLAWTESGGELLVIEAVAVPGKGKALYTGQLGDVMQESIQAAVTVLRTLSIELGLNKSFYEKWDLHIHVPDGATPKDGPSAGVAMCVALVSTFTEIPVRNDVAMTGEINLAGEILPIGGLKEKLLAAQSAGIKKVFIPFRNQRDLKELPESLLEALEIVSVKQIREVLRDALVRDPFCKLQTKRRTAQQDTEKSVKRKSETGSRKAGK